MTTEATAAVPGVAAAAVAQQMEVDLPTIDAIADARSREIAGQAAKSDSIRTLNGLAPGSAITDAHREVWARTLTEQMAMLTGPIRHRQIEAASVEAVRKKWLAAPSQPSTTSDPEMFPLEDCGKGEEMKRVSYLNKEVRRLEDEGCHFWPMETPADWLKTRRRLTSLFSDFALSRNERVKIWTEWPQKTSRCR